MDSKAQSQGIVFIMDYLRFECHFSFQIIGVEDYTGVFGESKGLVKVYGCIGLAIGVYLVLD